MLIELEGRGDAELEVWAANRSLAPLERALERPVRLQVRIVADDQESATRPPVERRRRRPGGAPDATCRAGAPQAVHGGHRRPPAGDAASTTGEVTSADPAIATTDRG